MLINCLAANDTAAGMKLAVVVRHGGVGGT